VLVISKLTYSGNCSYGLVGTNTSVVGSTILIIPTYCGYGDPTLTALDTFNLGLLPLGNYLIKVEYHQGSVCPASGFDATIGEAQIGVVVGPHSTTGFKDTSMDERVLIYPNPASEYLTVESNAGKGNIESIEIYNAQGETIYKERLLGSRSVIYLTGYPPGIYFIRVMEHGNVTVDRKVCIFGL
jgi:hypothetical protein